MINYPFDAIELSPDAIDKFQETYEILKAKFNIQPTGNINFHLNQLEVFRQYSNIKLRGSFVIKHLNQDSYVLFVETETKVVDRMKISTSYYEYQTWALAYLKQDFGRVLIRRETLADKIIELVHPVELDFAEDKPFSDTFYVQVNDHQKAVNAINRNFRNAVMDVRVDHFMIEIVDHTLIIGDRKPVSPERAVHLAEFVWRLSSMC
jgi:acetolactate synthase small subunit